MLPRHRLQRQLVTEIAAEVPQVPEAGRTFWNWFLDLHDTRQWSEAGPLPISYSEIRAYAELMRWPLRPCDVEFIRAMDRAYMNSFHKGEPTVPAVQAQTLTPAIFDAVLG